MKSNDLVLAVVIMAVFGCNFTVVKLGLGNFPPLFLLFLRFALVALILIPFSPVPIKKLPAIFGLSVTLGSLHFPMMFIGIAGIDAGTAAIASQIQVPFSSVLAAIVFKDLLGWRRLAGMAIALAGILVIAGEPRIGDGLGSLGLVVLASLLFAVASIQVKVLGPLPLFALNGWMTLFAAPQVLALSLILETGQVEAVRDAGWPAWLAIAYMVVPLTMFAHGFWFRLVNRYPVNQTAPFLLLAPVFGVAAAVAFLGEPLTPALATGGVLTIAGVGVIVLRKPKQWSPSTAGLDRFE